MACELSCKGSVSQGDSAYCHQNKIKQIDPFECMLAAQVTHFKGIMKNQLVKVEAENI